MCSVNVDFIAPKNSPYVTIHSASSSTITPTISTFTSAVTGGYSERTLTGSGYSIGNITTLEIHKFTFLGNDNSVVNATVPGTIKYPSVMQYYQLPVFGTIEGSRSIGSLTVDTNGVLSFYRTTSESSWESFVSDSSYTVFPVVVHYYTS